jgi:hypothetical protein
MPHPYERDGKVYQKRTGTRQEVYEGIAYSTGPSANSLRKEDITLYNGKYLGKKGFEVAMRKEEEEARRRERYERKVVRVKRYGSRIEVAECRAHMTFSRIRREDLYEYKGNYYTHREITAINAPGVKLEPLAECEVENREMPTPRKVEEKDVLPHLVPTACIDIVQEPDSIVDLLDMVSPSVECLAAIMTQNGQMYMVCMRKLPLN